MRDSLGHFGDPSMTDSVDDPDPCPGDARCQIEIVDDRRVLTPSGAVWLSAAARRAMLQAGATGEIRVRLINDREMSVAHERHCGVAGTTDVITFDLRERAVAGVPLDTDLLVCADEAARQAKARGITLEKELLLYVIHGMLHCLGHDDGDEESSRRMHAREDEILAAIDVGAVYSVPEAAESTTPDSCRRVTVKRST